MINDYKNPSVGELAGLLWTWWRDDVLPVLAALDELTITTPVDYELLAALSDADLSEIQERVASRHQPYVAWLAGEPVSCGWSAAGQTSFGSPPTVFSVPAANRYLLDFVTQPAWRGRGLYPRLLQAIVTREGAEVERFWILHRANNQASAQGIAKAGFQRVGEIHFLQGGGFGLMPTDNGIRAKAGSELLGMPLLR